MSKQFNILPTEDSKNCLVKSVPWGLVEPHREQAYKNHGQTLERLHERQGLSPVELWHVVHGKDWDGPLKHRSHISREDAIEWLHKFALQAS